MLDILLLQSTTAVAAQAAGNDFAEHDPTGLGMTLVAMAVVLSALLLIFLVFKYIGKGVDRFLSKGVVRPRRTVRPPRGIRRL